jgi:hypothetical protein
VLDVSDAVFAESGARLGTAAGMKLWPTATMAQTRYDDIVVLLGHADLCEHLWPTGKWRVFNLVIWLAAGSQRWRWTLAACTTTICMWWAQISRDLSTAYTTGAHAAQARRRAWMLGAAGPMGQMHLLRALTMPGKPARIVATNLHARAHGTGAQTVCAPGGRSRASK